MNESAVLVLGAIAFGIVRFVLPAHPVSFSGSYQAFAHVFVGFLIGGWWALRDEWNAWDSRAKFYLGLAAVLCFVEVVAAIATRVIQ